MSYAASGLARGIQDGLGMVSSSLLGIRQRRMEDEQARRQAEQDAQATEFRGLQMQGLRRDLNAPAPDPTRYAEHNGRTFDLRDASDSKEYGRATAPKPDTVEWDTEMTDNGMVQIHPVTGEVRNLGLRGPAKAPDAPRTGFRPNDGALVNLDTGAVITAGVPKPGDQVPPGGSPELTQDQGKSVSFYQRGRPALDLVESLSRQFGGATPETPEDQARAMVAGPRGGARLLGGLPVVGNMLKNPELQRYDQAVHDFAMAVLRKDSGATITGDEMDFVQQTYIPQVGDDPATARQKLDAAARAIESFRATAGPGNNLIGAPAPASGAPRRYSPENPYANRTP